MYKDFFQLAKAPFNLSPDIDCFFAEGKRKAILDALIYAIGDGVGIVKVVGEVGSGKTLMSRLLAARLMPSFEVVYLFNPRMQPEQILQAVALELGAPEGQKRDKIETMHWLNQRLLQLHGQGKRTVVVIDEAQTIPLDTLEEIRMLSNLETGHDKLLQLVLFGQPELDRHLNQYKVRQIKERIVHSFYLPRLSSAEVGRYLYFRLQQAGFNGIFPFSSIAVWLITLHSSGFLRRVNILADKCLLLAYSRQRKRIGMMTVIRTIFEHGFSYKWILVLTALLISVTMLFIWRFPQTIPIEQKWVRGNHTGAQYEAESTEFTQAKESDGGAAPELVKTAQIQTQERNFVKQDESMQQGYLIQLLSLVEGRSDKVASKIKQIVPKRIWRSVIYVPLKGSRYQIYLGFYQDYQTAEQVMAQLPSSLRQNQPFIVSLPNVIGGEGYFRDSGKYLLEQIE